MEDTPRPAAGAGRRPHAAALDGSSLRGHETTTRASLAALYGQPQPACLTDPDAATAERHVDTPHGPVAVYDDVRDTANWRTVPAGEGADWHLGAHSDQAAAHVRQAVADRRNTRQPQP